MLKIHRDYSQTDEQKSAGKARHPMMLLVIVVVLCALLTYIVPAGQYDREISAESGMEMVVPGSFHYVVRTPVSLMGLLGSLTTGMQKAASVIFFVMVAGGMFAIINGTGALNTALANAIKRMKGREILLIPILMTIFGCSSAFCGSFEEFLVFVPLILAVCITIGYDSLTAVGIIFIAATAGYAGSITNAFTEGAAQDIASVPRFSGMIFRAGMFICLEAVSVLYVMWMARAVKNNPKFSGSYVYDREFNKGKRIDLDNVGKLSRRQIYAILVFVIGIAIAVVGIIKWEYYVDELAAIFLAIGIAGGIVGGLKPGEICEYFVKGCRDMVLPCLMIGLANSAVVILSDANVMDSALHALAYVLQKMPQPVMPFGMFVFHEIINIIVPSGSAQAAVTMPLMIPLADKVGITRQTAVLAYQLGDAFTNIMSPTGGEILAALAICKVPFGKWVRYLLPLFIIWWIMAFAFLLLATGIGFGPI